MGDGDCIDVVDCEIGVSKGFMEDGIDGFNMGAGCNFWDNTTVFGVDINLGDDDVRQNFSAIFDNGGGCLVAGAFDSQNFHWL